MENMLQKAGEDPSLLCDLEGCGVVSKLENEFERICGTRFALAVSSGTAAIHAALLACDIGPGDEVIVTPYSWAQSVSPVLFSGATPAFADIDPQTLSLDPVSVKNRISTKTKAILPVHIFGHTADMVELQKIAKEAGVLLISDAAHGLGAKLNGRPIGAWGDIACFSLSRGKLVSGGEGGIIVTNNETIFEKAVSLTQHPQRLRRIKGNVHNEDFGLNYRIHPLAALLALSDVNNIEEKIKHRGDIINAYRRGLNKQDTLFFQKLREGENSAPYGVPLLYEHKQEREMLVAQAQSNGIPLRCGPVNVPLHLRFGKMKIVHPNFHSSQKKGACPVAERHCKKKELWALSPLDMDGISSDDAYSMGKRVDEIIKLIIKNEK